jgi:hypothetical protein
VRVATKDAYKALKAKVTRWASSEVAALEKTPESGARQAVLAEIIDNRPKEDQQAARELAEAVLKHLEGGKQMSLLPGITLLQPAGM